jgi:hypothetical protein
VFGVSTEDSRCLDLRLPHLCLPRAQRCARDGTVPARAAITRTDSPRTRCFGLVLPGVDCTRTWPFVDEHPAIAPTISAALACRGHAPGEAGFRWSNEFGTRLDFPPVRRLTVNRCRSLNPATQPRSSAAQPEPTTCTAVLAQPRSDDGFSAPGPFATEERVEGLMVAPSPVTLPTVKILRPHRSRHPKHSTRALGPGADSTVRAPLESQHYDMPAEEQSSSCEECQAPSRATRPE